MAAKRPRAVFEADQAGKAPYAFYGTPLPPLEAGGRDDGSYVPVWKQEVTDERGRKRLHGAFTGGFSAGYFNTVGSKEGWTPATFVSSRQHRARDAKQTTQQRPEDFMDEEDLREQEESRKLQTTEGFAGFGLTDADATRRAGLIDLLKTGGETMGVNLLKRMGWREGQGIGPKIRRTANLDEKTAAKDDGAEQTYLFAPENPPMVSFIRKTDFKGLGFEGETRLEAPETTRDEPQEDSDSFFGDRLAMDKKSKSKAKAKDSRRGRFGVGILNDTGSDDEDPYSLGPQIAYNKTIGGDKKKKKKKASMPTIASANPLLDTKPVFISKKVAAARTTGGFRKCRDGRLPLNGFVLADSLSGLSISDKKYEPPQIPEGWKPSKQATSSERDTSTYISTADAAKASSLDPTKRAAALGEAQLPGKSIFDWMTPEARERIAKLTGNTSLPPALGEKAPKGFETSDAQRRKDLWDLVPKLDKQIAVQALTRAVGGWMPYAEDEKKRARYRTFLEVRAELRDCLPDRVPGSSTEEWVNEMQEFARAAEVFKPMSGIMASRFTSASSGPKVASDAPDRPGDTPLSRPAGKLDSPAVAAAKIGMFGQMTRSEITFYPSRLLCKRFNVKPPGHVQLDPGEHPGSSESGPGTRFQSGGYQIDAAAARKELVSQEVMNMILMESGRQPQPTAGGAGSGSQPAAEAPPIRVVEPERNEALESERPGDAVFKAIFGSDGEEEE
ncbi:G patch domain-containing protein 1 [Penicillium rolfsii]|nr:G patch domain-containing protein 1 [Penicillium rolfsii]